MKRRIRHRDGSKISSREAQGLAKIAELMHEATAPVVWLPADMTCLRCRENQPLPDRLWCTSCVAIVDSIAAESIEKALR